MANNLKESTISFTRAVAPTLLNVPDRQDRPDEPHGGSHTTVAPWTEVTAALDHSIRRQNPVGFSKRSINVGVNVLSGEWTADMAGMATGGSLNPAKYGH
jgi:hypothetical protein